MASFSKEKAREIIQRLKDKFDIKTDSELATRLGLAETTITTWKRRGTVDIPLIIEQLGNISLDELIYGDNPEEEESPESNMDYTVFGLGDSRGESSIPLYTSRVSAGRPIEVTEEIEGYVYPNKRFHKGTFMVGVQGDSMIDAGILDGDKLLVDTLREPKNGNIVIARIDGELTVKRLEFKDGGILLSPENPKYKPIPVRGDVDIIGVVVSTQRDYI